MKIEFRGMHIDSSSALHVQHRRTVHEVVTFQTSVRSSAAVVSSCLKPAHIVSLRAALLLGRAGPVTSSDTSIRKPLSKYEPRF